VKCYDVGRAPLSGVHVIMCWRSLRKNFATSRAFSQLRKGITDKPLFDGIICLLDQFVLILDRIICMFHQFISKETEQHWFISRKASQKCKVVPDYVTIFTNQVYILDKPIKTG